MNQTPLALQPLTFLDEGDEVVVGRTDIDSYAVFPTDGAALLRELADGRTPADAAGWYQSRYGEPVDVDGFVATLRELDFVREHAGAPAADAPVRWRRLGRAAFSAPAWLAYAALIAAAVAVCLADGRFVPDPSHVFFSPYLVVIELTVLVAQAALGLVHEAFHVLAARRIGVNCRVRLSRRFYFVVFETVLDGLVVVPRRKRYLPMLAGMLADVLVIAGLTVAAYLLPGVRGLCLALAFTTIPRLAWQFYFYLRTDLYYLAVTALRCVDLDTVTRGVLRNRFNRIRGRTDLLVDEEAWHPRDRRVARWYAPLHVVGYAASLAMLVAVVVPLAWQFFGRALTALAGGDGAAAWDAALILALTVAQLVLAGVIALRERQDTRRTP